MEILKTNVACVVRFLQTYLDQTYVGFVGIHFPVWVGLLISMCTLFSLSVNECTSTYLPSTKLSAVNYLSSIHGRVCLCLIIILTAFFLFQVRIRIMSLNFSVRVGMIQ